MEHLANIIHLCRKGDAKAQKVLFDHLKGRLMGICLRYSPSAEEAKDIFQEAVIKIFKSLGGDPRIENFMGWAVRITVNTAIDHYKKRRKEMFVYYMDDESPTDLSDDELNALEKMEAEEVIQLVESLPFHHSIVFNMFMIEGYSHREIADQLSIAESTSRVLLTRAKKALIGLLKKTTVHEQICG